MGAVRIYRISAKEVRARRRERGIYVTFPILGADRDDPV